MNLEGLDDEKSSSQVLAAAMTAAVRAWVEVGELREKLKKEEALTPRNQFIQGKLALWFSAGCNWSSTTLQSIEAVLKQTAMAFVRAAFSTLSFEDGGPKQPGERNPWASPYISVDEYFIVGERTVPSARVAVLYHEIASEAGVAWEFGHLRPEKDAEGFPLYETTSIASLSGPGKICRLNGFERIANAATYEGYVLDVYVNRGG